jgi:hypothetical protein
VKGLELNGAHKLLVYADNLVEEDTNSIHKNTNILLNGNKVGLGVSAEKSKYVYVLEIIT